jgi:hypothetical protein
MNLALAHELPIPQRETDPDRFNAYLLNVDFESPDGGDWSAIGGGESVAEGDRSRTRLAAGRTVDRRPLESPLRRLALS